MKKTRIAFCALSALSLLAVAGSVVGISSGRVSEPTVAVKAEDEVTYTDVYVTKVELEATGSCYITIIGSDNVVNATANAKILPEVATNAAFNFLDNIVFNLKGVETKLRDIANTDNIYWNRWTRQSSIFVGIDADYAASFLEGRVGGSYSGNTYIINQGTTFPDVACSLDSSVALAGLKTSARAEIDMSRDYNVSSQCNILGEVDLTSVMYKSDYNSDSTKKSIWFGVGVDYGSDPNLAVGQIATELNLENKVKVNGQYLYQMNTTDQMVTNPMINPWTWWGNYSVTVPMTDDLTEVFVAKGTVIPRTAFSYNVTTLDSDNKPTNTYASVTANVGTGYITKSDVTFVVNSKGNFVAKKADVALKTARLKAWDSGYMLSVKTDQDGFTSDELLNIDYVSYFDLYSTVKLYDNNGAEVPFTLGNDAYSYKVFSDYTYTRRIYAADGYDLANVTKIVFPEGMQIPDGEYVNADNTLQEWRRGRYAYELKREYTVTKGVGEDSWIVPQHAGDPVDLGTITLNGSGLAYNAVSGSNLVTILYLSGVDYAGICSANEAAEGIARNDFKSHIKLNGTYVGDLGCTDGLLSKWTAPTNDYFGYEVPVDTDTYSFQSMEIDKGTKFPSSNKYDYYTLDHHYIKMDQICELTNADNIDAFVSANMKMDTISTSDAGTGLCVSDGWYSAAKTAFNSLTYLERVIFNRYSAYNDAYARLSAWATANNEVVGDTGIVAKAARLTFLGTEEGNSVLPYVVALGGVALAGVALLGMKKKKETK